ncbi:MAG: HAD-IA family hydrolase, partial [Chloroflexi bacterium]|nr:HAD-IA family hydrolase [Chloroflexota bacterium]
LIKRLCQRYRVAMLSNATDILEQRLRDNYAVNQYFDPIINSAVIGIAKPDPAIYRHLLDRLALEAGQVLFIDDKAENIAAAAALGMHVIWYVSSAELERQLTPYLGLDVSSSTTD